MIKSCQVNMLSSDVNYGRSMRKGHDPLLHSEKRMWLINTGPHLHLFCDCPVTAYSADVAFDRRKDRKSFVILITPSLYSRPNGHISCIFTNDNLCDVSLEKIAQNGRKMLKTFYE